MLFLEDADGQIRQAKNILKNKIVKDYLSENPNLTRKDLKNDTQLLNSLESQVEFVLNELLKITNPYQDKSIPNNPGINQAHLPYLANFYNEGTNLNIIKFYYDKFINTPSVHRNKEIFNNFHSFETIIDSNQKIDTKIKTKNIDDPPIYEDENIKVFHGSDMDRCIKYGQENKYNLCISRPEKTNNLFHSYRIDGLTTYFVYLKNENKEPPFIIVDATPDPNEFSYNPINPQTDYKISKDDLIDKYPFLKKPIEMGIFKNVSIEGKEKEFYDKFYNKSIISLTDFNDKLEFISFKLEIYDKEWDLLKLELNPNEFQILLKTAIENDYIIPFNMFEGYEKLYERYIVKQKQKAEILEKQIREKVVGGIYKGNLKIENMVFLPNLKDIEVTGNFDCSDNKLISLEGAPKSVGGDFSCDSNKLTSLEGAPRTIRKHFYCYSNQLTNLEGAPEIVEESFDCSTNQLTTLQGAPKMVGGNFVCSGNPLTNLKGAPETVRGSFYCSESQLTSLEGAPKTVGGTDEDSGNFDCSYNKLTSLEGAPKSVGGNFDCTNNQLTSLEGAPKTVGKSFFCGDNDELTTLKGAPKEIGYNFHYPGNFTREDMLQAMKERRKSEELKSESFKYFFYSNCKS